MKKNILIALIIITSMNCYAQLTINEIMYNPEGNDNNKEFIEVIADNISLENFTISDSESNDTLHLLYLPKEPNEYALVVEEDYTYEKANITIYSAGNTIGNNLNNDQDTICIYNKNHTLMACTTYNNTYANNNGMSLENCNGTWHESIIFGGTPGNINSACIITNETNQTDNKSNTANSTTHNIQKYSFNISTSKTIFEEDEKVSYKINTNASNFIIEYWIEDLYGQIVKDRYNTTNTNTRSWSPSKGGVYIIKALLHTKAKDQNKSADKIIIIKEPLNNYKTNIEILDVSSDSIKFGDIVELEILITKADTLKKTIYAYIQDRNGKKVSKKTKLSLPEKNSQIYTTIPIQTLPDCEKDNEGNKYELVVEGLDKKEEIDITIEGHSTSLCKETVVYKETQTTKTSETKSSDNNPKIKSLYTLTKKYSESINIYATFNEIQLNPSILKTIVLHTNNNRTEMQIDDNSKKTFKTTPEKGKNLAILELRQDNITKDIKFLEFWLSSDEELEKESIKETERKLEKKTEEDKYSTTTTETTKDSIITAEVIGEKNSSNSTIFISDSEKNKNYTRYLFIPLILTLSLLALKTKNYLKTPKFLKRHGKTTKDSMHRDNPDDGLT